LIPIFIITCDRLEVLKQSIASYNACIGTPFEVVITDFGSTYQPTVEFLEELEWRGTEVYWEDKITNPDELSKVGGYIQDYFKSHPKSNYVVTDPDVALYNIEGDVLEVYSYLLRAYPTFSVVGPMLQIDDIPDCYPYKQKILSGEMGMHKHFHSKPVQKVQYNGHDVRYINAHIDTTFGMYRATFPWRRLSSGNLGARVLSPYGAHHLDWYIDPSNMSEDQEYYTTHANPSIAHWGKL